ncbi:hypothetical protein CFP56_021945 [Quercus suber]|uniref:Uncharacterized protein n=1 Tax=Quercus suber TaxID=58331 RepID=A0AAW0KE84_QUESU
MTLKIGEMKYTVAFVFFVLSSSPKQWENSKPICNVTQTLLLFYQIPARFLIQQNLK